MDLRVLNDDTGLDKLPEPALVRPSDRLSVITSPLVHLLPRSGATAARLEPLERSIASQAAVALA